MVASHWILDFFVHRSLPILPFYPARTGLGLWTNTSVEFNIGLELGLFYAGIAMYLLTSSTPKQMTPWQKRVFALFIILCTVAQCVFTFMEAPAELNWLSFVGNCLLIAFLCSFGLFFDRRNVPLKSKKKVGKSFD